MIDDREAISGDFWPDEREAELRRLLAEGATRAEIASRLGVSRNAVAGKIDRMGLSGAPRTRVTPEAYRLRRREAAARRRAKALAAAARPPQPKAKPATPRLPRGKVRIWNLAEYSCRWPLFEGREPVSEQFYCGAEAVRGARTPYCSEHCRMAMGSRG